MLTLCTFKLNDALSKFLEQLSIVHRTFSGRSRARAECFAVDGPPATRSTPTLAPSGHIIANRADLSFANGTRDGSGSTLYPGDNGLDFDLYTVILALPMRGRG